MNNRHTWLLFGLAAGMFGFAFALVPLYNVFCEVTGLNGKTSSQATLLEEIDRSAVDVRRTVTLGFLGKVSRGLAWEFRPTELELVVNPGEMNMTTYYARNRSTRTVTVQAVPSVSPGRAAQYLKKIECFCFEQQSLAPGEELEMAVRFVVDAEIPAEIEELTLSYTMFPLDDADNEHTAHLRE